MIKFFKLIGYFLTTLIVITFVVLVILYFVRDLESIELDQTSKEQASGQFVNLSDGSTHFQVAGPDSGEIVVLVHGFSVPFYIWDGTFEALASNGFRVLRYDLYGRGYSDRPDVVYNRSLYERQLLDLLNNLQVDSPINLIGLSMGGAITVGFSVQYPAKIDKLVLIDPMFRSTQMTKLPEFMTSYIAKVFHAHKMADNQTTDFFHPELFAKWADRYNEQMKYKGFVRAIVSTIHHYLPDDHSTNYEQLSKLNKSILLVWGKEDQTIPFEGSQIVRNTLDVEFLPVEEAGHLPHLEKAKEVNASIIEFLTR